MFAYLRSKNAVLAKYQFLMNHIATKMRENVRSQNSSLDGFDVSNVEIAGVVAEIYMREFACTLNVLNQVHGIVSRYHEDAFDNTDAYIEGMPQPVQLPPHEMTTEQRHASQLLLGVGRNSFEINMSLKMFGCEILTKDITECSVAKIKIVAEHFQNNPPIAEDMFDRLNYITKQVWSLVNMLAFSNLFRFADPMQPVSLPNQNDAIFIPYIPTKSTLPPDENPKNQM